MSNLAGQAEELAQAVLNTPWTREVKSGLSALHFRYHPGKPRFLYLILSGKVKQRSVRHILPGQYVVFSIPLATCWEKDVTSESVGYCLFLLRVLRDFSFMEKVRTRKYSKRLYQRLTVCRTNMEFS